MKIHKVSLSISMGPAKVANIGGVFCSDGDVEGTIFICSSSEGLFVLLEVAA